MREGFNISGLTTAASIWASSVIGILVGVGFYLAAMGLALLSAGDHDLPVAARRLAAVAPRGRHHAALQAGLSCRARSTLRRMALERGYEIAGGSLTIGSDQRRAGMALRRAGAVASTAARRCPNWPPNWPHSKASTASSCRTPATKKGQTVTSARRSRFLVPAASARGARQAARRMVPQGRRASTPPSPSRFGAADRAGGRRRPARVGPAGRRRARWRASWCWTSSPATLRAARPASFAGDALALAAARKLVDSGADRELTPMQRWFAYMPFEHAEDAAHAGDNR